MNPSSDETLFSEALAKPPAERAAFLDQACAGDPVRRARLESLLRAQAEADGFLEKPTTPGDASARTVELPRPPDALRPAPGRVHYFGDYELIEEIARGGMGIVWRARQVSLNRTVAVKMILAGQFANEAEVKRFRVEAEAAANLQHPNIVAIHEIGEHEGQHYFSMDFIAGRNLAEHAAAQPLSALEIARLMKMLAEAVHYAHQRGTLHRDLKPANVLIDAQGQPHITDFGLAKRWAAPTPDAATAAPAPSSTTSELTQTGAVMGSPSYMAPEQAAARADAIGPATDVYSLGAIFYQLLTGQPPHRGATALDTIQRVLAEEPPAPRSLRADLPEDLETICLKCLEKTPERRYATARQLAEELERFVAGEPILAKPASPLRKAWSWTLRNPWAFAVAAGLALILSFGAIYGLWEQMRFERRQGLLHKAKQLAQSMPAETAKRGALYTAGMEALQEAVKIWPDSDVRPLAKDLLSRSGRAFRRIEHAHGAGPKAMQAVTVSADGRFLAAAFKDGVAEIFSVDSGKSVFKTPTLNYAKPLVALSADGAWFALADESRVPGEVRLWHWSESAAPMIVPAHAGAVTALLFSPAAGARLVTGGQASTEMGRQPELKFWDAGQSSPTATVACFGSVFDSVKAKGKARRPGAPVNKISLLDFSPDGTRLLARTDVGQAELLRVDGPLGGNVDTAAIRPQLRMVIPRRGVAFSSDGRALLSAAFPHIKRTDLATGQAKVWFTVPDLRGSDVSSSARLGAPDGRYVVHDDLAFDSQAPAQSVRLPARVRARGPQGTWLTYEPAQAAFQFWRVDDVREEWNRFALQSVMRRTIDTLDETFTWHLIVGVSGFVLVPCILLFALRGLFSVTPTGRPGGWSSRWGFGVRLAVGTACSIASLALMARFVYVGVWQTEDTYDGFATLAQGSLVNAACVAMVLGVAVFVRAFRGYQASLVGMAAPSYRSSRMLWAALFVGVVLEGACFAGPFAPWLEADLLKTPAFIPAWIAGMVGGMMLGYVTMRLLADESRSRRQRQFVGLTATGLWWIIGGFVGHWILDFNAARVFGSQFMLSAIPGGLIAIVVSRRVHHWFDEEIAAARRRQTEAATRSYGAQLERIATMADDWPAWYFWPFGKPAPDQHLGWVFRAKTTVVFGPLLGLVYVFALRYARGTPLTTGSVVGPLLLGCAVYFVLVILWTVGWNRRARRLREGAKIAPAEPQSAPAEHPIRQ